MKIGKKEIELLYLSIKPEQLDLLNVRRNFEAGGEVQVFWDDSDGSQNNEFDIRTGKANAVMPELQRSDLMKRELTEHAKLFVGCCSRLHLRTRIIYIDQKVQYHVQNVENRIYFCKEFKVNHT